MGYQTTTAKKYEIRTTKDGIQYMAVYDDIEITGFIASRSKAVVERIVKLILAGREPPPAVSAAADLMIDYITSVITRFKTEYVSTSTTIMIGNVRMTLHAYLNYYSDEEKKIEEWRGQTEALVEDGKSRHLVKKRIIFDKEVSGFAVYRALMQVARHAYGIQEE